MISSAIVCQGHESGLPVFLEVDIAFELLARLVHSEAAFFEDLNDARRLRIDSLAGDAVDCGHANHLRIAAQEYMGRGGIEGPTQALFKLSAREQILNVDLLTDRVGLARRETEVLVVAVAARQFFLDRQVAEIAAVAHTTGGED